MNYFYDSIIFLYLIASGTLAVGLFRDRRRPGKREHRHQKFTLTAVLLLCCSAVLVFWGSFIEPRLIAFNQVSVDLPNFEPTQPVRVALISDIHVGTYKKDGWLRRVLKRIILEKPDLVLLGGDFIVDQPRHAQYLSDFQSLTSDFQTFAVLGDHDYNVHLKPYSIDAKIADTVEHALTKTGVRVLKNEGVLIKRHDASFTLVGLDDWLAGKTRMSTCAHPCVTLIHNPDFILDPQSKNADLILAGNTHGGQVRLPWIGPVARLPSKLPRSFDKGLFDLQYTKALPAELWRQGLLFITSGISESGPRARLFNLPEIVLLELH